MGYAWSEEVAASLSPALSLSSMLLHYILSPSFSGEKQRGRASGWGRAWLHGLDRTGMDGQAWEARGMACTAAGEEERQGGQAWQKGSMAWKQTCLSSAPAHAPLRKNSLSST